MGLSSAPVFPDRNVAQGRRFLVADDTQIVRVSLARALSKLGGIVDTAADGAQAVWLAARVSYDLILLDVNMRDMTGFEAAASILEGARSKGLPPPALVLMSAEASQDDRARFLSLGLDGLLEKPIRLGGLLDLINAGNRRRSESNRFVRAETSSWRLSAKALDPVLPSF